MSHQQYPGQEEADARLLIGASEADANIYYATRFFAPDPFVYVEVAGVTYVMVSDLELDRARSEAKADNVVAQSEWTKKARASGLDEPKLLDALDLLLKELGVASLMVPGALAVEYADGLRLRGYELRVKAGPFFEGRLLKSSEEVEEITRVLQSTEAALDVAIGAVRDAKVAENGALLASDGGPLTSEAIKRMIGRHLLDHECLAAHTIVAGGEQAVDPHERGYGPLRAGEPIVIDIFPRCLTTGYYADITRTVIKGPATDAQRGMYEAILEAMELAFGRIRDGADAQALHQAILDLFEAKGFSTGEQDGRMQGFFHSTGHGLGLEIHEPPRISKAPEILRAGMVVTVEPGLYYAGKGGIRVEDIVVVEVGGCRNLTAYPKFLEV
jgi:Xaa-Pro aminopeptidase